LASSSGGSSPADGKVANAIKYQKPGVPTVHVSAARDSAN
jgi:hypothetical protein